MPIMQSLLYRTITASSNVLPAVDLKIPQDRVLSQYDDVKCVHFYKACITKYSPSNGTFTLELGGTYLLRSVSLSSVFPSPALGVNG